MRNGCSTFARILAFRYSILMAVLFLRGCFFSARTLPGRSAISHSTSVPSSSSRFSAPWYPASPEMNSSSPCNRLCNWFRSCSLAAGGYQRMGQAALGIHTNMGFHAEVPLVTFFGLMHLRVTFILFVFSGAGCFNNRGIHQCSLRHHHTAVGQPLIGRFE